MYPVVTADEMRLLDRLTIEDAGIPGMVLMENAAREVTQAVQELYDGQSPVTVIAGTGNNGGDGLAVARQLTVAGVETLVVLVGGRELVSGDALTQLDIVDTLGIDIIEVDEDDVPEEAFEALELAGVCVDAVFGVGLSRNISGPAATILEALADVEAMIVSVDLPSGVCPNTGQVLGIAVAADVTVTFGMPKRGHTQYPGRALAGELIVADIGIPPAIIAHVGPQVTLSSDIAPPYLPPRPPHAHKGQFGHIVIVGGGTGTSGAALLAGMAALRCGAGLCTVVTHTRVQGALEGRYPELMIEAGWSDEGLRSQVLDRLLDVADVIVAGPGLAVTPLGRAVVDKVLEAERPVVLDAGALSILAPLGASGIRGINRVITPHPGEAGRLLGMSSADVQIDRFAAVSELSARVGGTVVLKGAATLVASEDAGISVNTSGNPGMATAGTGDVLAGMCAAFMARELDTYEAVRTAVYVHGLAGDAAADLLGMESVIATDVLEALPGILHEQPTA